MKKLAALLLGAAMVMTSVLGLAACNGDGKGPDKPGPDTPGPDTPGPDTPGPDKPGPGPVVDITRRTDPRDPEAYEAYDYQGNKVGSYKTIAAAINATVEADLDFMEDEETPVASKGGYVTKKGSDFRLFQNKKGFADGNDDQFWYYQDGTSLAGYNCWDATNGLSEIQNQKIIAHKISDQGLASIQTWNGYGLLDAQGQEISTTKTLPNTYELSAPMDAAVMAFTGEKKGVGGMRYELDLSETKITPAYEGVEEDVYAFFGYYAWQGYYVVANGLACNTLTGEWYPFRGTSRDDSFSDVIYNVDELDTPLMTSTWNKEGYWTCDTKTVEMEIKTTRNIDEVDGAEFWTDELTFKFDGKDGYRITIDDQMIGSFFPGNAVSPDNTYVFIAGLDIKSTEELEDPGMPVKVKNTDYFNGAKFENLVVAEAAAYIPTAEELSDEDYGGTIDEALRGTWQDFVMANEEYTAGSFAYTILQNYTFTSYEGKDSVDYYSFSFDRPTVSENELGGKLKDYQEKIDSLSGMTVDNVKDYLDDYNEVAGWYGADDSHTGAQGILQQYLLLLDFTAFKDAQEVYRNSFKLTEEAQAVLTDLETLSILTNYPYKGWTAAEDEDVTGYLWSEAQKFGKIYERYQKLPKEDQNAILRLYAGTEDEFNNWVDAYESIKAYLDGAGETSYTIGHRDMNGKSVTYNAEEALAKLFELGFKIWTTTYTGAAEPNVMDSDNTDNYKDSFHLLFLMKKMEEKKVELPYFFEEVVYAQITRTARAENFAKDFNNYIYPVLTLAGQIYARQAEGEFVWLNEEIANVVNTYMVGFEDFTEAGFKWNRNNNRDLRDVETNYEYYFGLPNVSRDIYKSLEYVFAVVESCDPTAVRNNYKLGFTAKVTPLAEDPTKNGSEAAKATVSEITGFASLAAYDYKGWKTEGEDKTGYLYEDLTKFRALATKREGLTPLEKAYIAAQLTLAENKAADTNFKAWETFSEEVTALEASGVWKLTFKTFAQATGKDTKSYTAEEAFAELLHVAFKIKTEGLTENAGGDTAKVGVLDVNSNFNSAARLVSFYDFFMRNEAVLPTFVTGITDALGVPAYYNEFFYPLSGMVRIAVRIDSGDITKMEEFSDEELEFLNEYWVSTYELKGILKSHWYANGKHFGWIDWKLTGQFTAMLGGTLEGKTLPNQYADILNALLQKSGYQVNELNHNWGVTATEIFDTTFSKEVLEVVAEFDKIGSLDTYKTLGWKSSDGTVKGYLYNEAEYYENTIKAMIAKLDENGQEDLATLVGADNLADWEALAPAILAFNEEQAKTVIHAAESDNQNAKQKDYTVGESLGVLLQAIADANAAGQKLGFDNGINEGVSFRPYFFYFALEELEVEIPDVIVERFEAVKMEATKAELFEEDLHYIITVMRLAKAITDNPEYQLTADDVAMINAYLVGKEKFVDGGFAYAFETDSKYTADVMSWHGKSKGYKSYFGLTEDFNVYQSLVIGYLVDNYDATAIHYNKAGAPADCYMGIEKPIALPEA